MHRLLFEKTGDAVWISHLDLMRLFQRAFKRGGLPLKHTQGFSPRPSVSIALPMSVGVESVCELLDFELDGALEANVDILSALNGALISGVKVLQVYESDRKIRDIALMDCTVTLIYDAGIPAGAEESISALFQKESLVLEKRNRNGVSQQDIIPMIRAMEVSRQETALVLRCRVCCQNPTLNPNQLASAIEKYLPEYTPDFFKCRRDEIYTKEETVFR